MKRTGLWFAGMIGAGMVLSLSGFQSRRQPKEMTDSFFAMNTYNAITLYGDSEPSVLNEVKRKLQEWERLWSVTDTNSELYRINHSGGSEMELSEDTAELLQFSLEMAKETGGALDITVYPVLTAWGFTTESHQVPSEDLLKDRLSLVGYDRISLTGTKLWLPEGMQIDFGSVAKGYAADGVTETLKAKGIDSAIISLGGSLSLIGSKPDGSDFKVSVEHPENRDSLGILSLSDTCVVTSGAYERYFTGADGKNYGHILNPKTGMPAESDLASVTVIGAEGRLCDALSTAFFVMGAEAAERYWMEHGNFEMLLVTADGKLLLTEGLEHSFSLAEAYLPMPVSIIRR